MRTETKRRKCPRCYGAEIRKLPSNSHHEIYCLTCDEVFVLRDSENRIKNQKNEKAKGKVGDQLNLFDRGEKPRW